MNNGAFGENFPYSNFHNLNMDWIIKIAKDFLDQYTHIQELIENGETDITNLTNQSLDNLQNLADHLNDLLQQWYDTHSADIANQLADALNDLNAWFNEHSLDISNQLADAISVLNLAKTNALTTFNTSAEQKAQETIASIPSDYTQLAKTVNRVHHNLEFYNPSNLLNMMKTYTFNATHYGVSIIYDEIEDCFILNGTSNAEGWINLYVDASKIIDGLVPGEPFIYKITRSNINIISEVYSYYSNTWNSLMQITQFNTIGLMQAILPAQTEGMLIRIKMLNNVTFINEKIKIEIFKDILVNYNGVIGACIPESSIPCENVIEYYLSHHNRLCVLSLGTHYISRSLRMFTGASLVGTNFSACTLKPTDSNFDAIIIEDVSKTLISNLNIEGLVQNIGSDPTNFGAGVHVIGHDTADSPRYNIIENCQIHFFQGGGIVLDTNSYWVAHGVTIKSCELWKNYAGIRILPKSEYHRVSDCLIYGNYIGILNNGGNNTFDNCSLTENATAFYITDSATINNGHGSISNCTLNHNNNNNGFAVIIRNVQNGYIFSNCNIWYGKIIVSGSAGINFANCNIGNGATPQIESDENDSMAFNGCMFKTAPTVSEYQSNTFFHNCYTFDGTPVT